MSPKLLWCILAGALQCAGSFQALAQSSHYTISLAPRFNSVANHLNLGQNRLDQIFPAVPDGATFYKFNPVTQSYYEPAVFFAGKGWVPGGPSESAVLRPGEGGFMQVETQWSLTMTGEPVLPRPRTDLVPGYNFVSCQTLGDCSFQEALGVAPRLGDRVYLYDKAFTGGLPNLGANASSVHTYGANGWDTVPTFSQGRSAMVRLMGSPHITQNPVSQTVTQNSVVNFAVTATGTQPLFYQWRYDGVLLIGQTNRTLAIPSAQPSHAGPYWVSVSNVLGSVTSAPAFLMVLTPPTIIEPPSDLTVIAGNVARFSAAATGTPPLRYLWRHDGQLLPSSLQGYPVLTLSNVQPSDAGSYRVTVTNLFGSTSPPPAELTVLEPPTIVFEPVGQTNFPGVTVVFAVEAVGTPPLNYTWRRNGAVIPVTAGPALTLRNVQLTDSGIYSVTVHNAAGAIDSHPVPLWIYEDPLPFTDSFADAIVAGGLYQQGRGDNFKATFEPKEPVHFGKRGGKSVWLKWSAPSRGIVTFHTRGSTFDTLLAAYRGSELGALEEMASDDDSGGYLTSEIRFNIEPNVIYAIAVDGLGGAEGDFVFSWNFEPTTEQLPIILNQPTDRLVTSSNLANFFVRAEQVGALYQWFRNNQPLDGQNGNVLNVPASPATVGTYFARIFLANRFLDSRHVLLQFNSSDPGVELAPNLAQDKFADSLALLSLPSPPLELQPRMAPRAAAPMTLVSGYVGTQVFSTYGAGSESGEPVHCGVVGGASEWFYYIAPTNGTVHVNTDGSTFDTVLAVYTGPGTSFSTLVPVACDNNSGANGLTSKLQFPATADTIYYVAVDGVAGATGSVNLNYRLLVPLVLTNMTLTGKVAKFDITATPSYPFTVQVSTNLVNWNRLVVTNTPSGTMTLYESNPPSGSQRFYRARQTP